MDVCWSEEIAYNKLGNGGAKRPKETFGFAVPTPRYAWRRFHEA